MTHSNYNERQVDEKIEVSPEWYRRILNWIVGYNVYPRTVPFTTCDFASSESNLHIHN